MPGIHEIIVRPLVTEATSAAFQERGEYTFQVHPEASKGAIRAAVEQLFGVKVTGVWTSQLRGQARRVGTNVGRRPHWKKAIVKLREGDSISIFEGQ
jgi:large subunit ribosomal protein L23